MQEGGNDIFSRMATEDGLREGRQSSSMGMRLFVLELEMVIQEAIDGGGSRPSMDDDSVAMVRIIP